jgi:aryl-alcohol dehydrogenase-like predicted oxidoreductase
MEFTRRNVVKLGFGTAVASALWPRLELFAQAPPVTKAIPSTGERIPVIGIGTNRFGLNAEEAARRGLTASSELRPELKEVLRRLPELGAKVVDTASSYPGSEETIGELTSELGNRDRLFIGTKVSATGKQEGVAEIEQSFKRLRTSRIDLIEVHGMQDPSTQLETLRELKQAGRIRYIGATTSEDNQYGQVEAVLAKFKLDFIQIDYSVDNRGVEARILPMAAERGTAVMINRPFGGGNDVNRPARNVLAKLGKTPLPDWAGELGCKTWAQFFLKYIVSHPHVTCAIPGTRSVAHLLDNMQAMHEPMPNAAMRRRMEEYIEKV